MKSGFLAPGAKQPKAPAAAGQPNPSVSTGTAQAGHAASDPVQPAGQGTAQVLLSPEQWDANFSQCLELLKGPGDERRFVGLLLATKLLPQGGDEAIRRVMAALGWRFLTRLLLPLSKPQAGGAAAQSTDAREQHAVGAGLGLAILSAACRLPDLASTEEVVGYVPALCKVAASGGVSALLQLAPIATGPSPGPSPGPAAGSDPQQQQQATAAAAARAQADAAAVSEALEALVAACSCSPAARAAALAANGLGAAAAVIVRLVASSSSSHSKSGSRKVGPPASWHAPVLAVRLLGLLLEGGPGERQALLTEHVRVLQGAVPALGHLLGSHQLLASASAAAAAAGSRGTAAAAKAGADAAAATADQEQALQGGGSCSSGTGHEDGAVLQLECLHALLLLLPLLPTCPPLAAHVAASARPRKGGATASGGTAAPWAYGWAVAVRRGLGWVLRSRVGAVQKHSALQLAACMVELLGPPWLLGPEEEGGAVQKQRQAAPAGSQFVSVLAETLHVEAGLLMQDALHPSVLVEQHVVRGDTRSQWRAPEPSQGFLQDLRAQAAQRGEDEDEEEEEGDQPPAAAGAPSGPKPMAVEAGGARPTAAAAPGAGAVAVTAGERAAARLPAVYALLEACMEALAQDAAASEEGLDGDFDGDEDDTDMAGDRDEEGVGAGGGRGGRGPLLSPAAQQGLLASLGRTVDGMTAFLEAAAEAQAFLPPAPEPVYPDIRPKLPLFEQGGAGAPPAADAAAGPAQPGTAGGAAAAAAGAGSEEMEVEVFGEGEGDEPAGAGGASSSSNSSKHSKAAAAAQAAMEAAKRVEQLSLQQQAALAAPPPEVLLGCVRVVGRFLAEVPDALSPALRSVVPYMLAMGGGSTGGATSGMASSTASGTLAEAELRAMAVRFLAPGLLQVLSTRSEAAQDLRHRICASAPALASVVQLLCAAAARATEAAPAVAAAAATLASGRQLASGVLVRLQELASAEQELSDLSMLLLCIVDPERGGAAVVGASGCGSSGSSKAGGKASRKAGAGAKAAAAGDLGPGQQGSSSSSQEAATSQQGQGSGLTNAREAAVAGVSSLGPVTQQLFPALEALSQWAAVRASHMPAATGNGASGGTSGQAGTSSSSAAAWDSPTGTVMALAAARLMPRTLLCSGCLAGVVLDAVAQQHFQHHSLAAQEGSKGQGGSGAAGSGQPAPPLPVPDPQVQAACGLMGWALKVGLALNAAVVYDDEGELLQKLGSQGGSGAGAPGQGLGPMPTPSALVADMAGDGEVCWERLLGAAASCLALLPGLQRELSGAQAGAGMSGTQGWLSWLEQLEEAAGEGLGSASALGADHQVLAEVVASSVGARLLLTTAKAVAGRS